MNGHHTVCQVTSDGSATSHQSRRFSAAFKAGAIHGRDMHA